ncbi:MAG TPA: HDIG domain-containing protein [Treponemataceae bacterium]|nr:HDIG domain-containing protein [Treponemataceae bacterium]HPS43678.1 HDIG domain-containing protein [Treponemataceae bacterium]
MNRKRTDLPRIRYIPLLLGKMREKAGLLILVSCAFALLTVATYFSFMEVNGFRKLNLVDFEIGKVADRDVIASRGISLVDENATRIRRDARQRLVSAVFRYDRDLSESMVEEYSSFIDYLGRAMQGSNTAQQFLLETQQEYPGVIEKRLTQTLYNSPDRAGLLSISQNLFKQLVNEGIIAFPDAGMEKFNQSDIELVHWKNDRQERIEVPKDSIMTMDEVKTRIANSLALMKKSPAMADTIYSLIRPFLKVNVVYQTDESESKLDAAIRQVPPVLMVIDKGQKIIKRGFIITEESFGQLEALANSGVFIDVRQFAGTLLVLLSIGILAFYVFSSAGAGPSLEYKSVLLLVLSFSIMYLLVLITGRFHPFLLPLDHVVVIPAALFAMLITVLVGQRAAVLMSFISALGVLCASNFALPTALFVLFSGITGVGVMRITGKRIDLVKSACILAAVNPLIAVILQIAMPGSFQDASFALVGAAVNGFMSGILVLGFLPILESAFNTSTSFRLMEFSDLNSPIMKRMLLSVSGTYNHSIMVATLAESACREIGADPLLARVGAYYHDIGKMDQSEYFVENQLDYNKHLDLNPRLSATVIRSHVKLGVEKARAMRLPKEVIDIIAEHHGNSVISYFYNEAKKLNDSVDPEDFMYPGNPPRSKESAVVMLADVVEAACRTLEKPSVPRLERFIGELVSKKIETNQLENSDLTFHEISIIKKTFVNILAGYYHSRIEYPNQKDPDAQESAVREGIIKGRKA